MILALPFFLFFGVIMLASVVALVFWVVSIIEVAKAPEPAFGPPWDNGKSPWILGLVISTLIPLGAIVTTYLWWTQGHNALRAGRLVPKPFWAPSRTAPYPYGYPPAPPQYPPQHPPYEPPAPPAP